MTQQVVDAINAYGLPGWATILIAAGTIVAALIAAVQSITVAAFNARASRLMAIDAAHREHRQSTVQPILEHVRVCTTVAFEMLGRDSVEAADVVVQTGLWRQRLDGATPTRRIWVGDANLHAALMSFHQGLERVKEQLAYPDQAPPFDLELAKKAARNLTTRAAVVETAVEGYVFGIRRVSRQARRDLQRLANADTEPPHNAGRG